MSKKLPGQTESRTVPFLSATFDPVRQTRWGLGVVDTPASPDTVVGEAVSDKFATVTVFTDAIRALLRMRAGANPLPDEKHALDAVRKAVDGMAEWSPTVSLTPENERALSMLLTVGDAAESNPDLSELQEQFRATAASLAGINPSATETIEEALASLRRIRVALIHSSAVPTDIVVAEVGRL